MVKTSRSSCEQKSAFVLGAGGFIGSHLVRKLKSLDYYVIGVDRKYPEFSKTCADMFIIGDLREQDFCKQLFNDYRTDEVYQLAAEMGGAGFIFTGQNDAQVVHSSAQINLNILENMVRFGLKTVFFSSSACVYPKENQQDPETPTTHEDSVYPANPDSEYGWEKLFAERLYATYARNHGLSIRIARFHNIFGPECTWQGGREKAPAAICRKIAAAPNHTEIEIWGDGKQTRSFLYIDDCLDAVMKLMASSLITPINIGSEEMVSINHLTEMIMKISGKSLSIFHSQGPEGVRGRTSDNTLIRNHLHWEPKHSLEFGLKKTYSWIADQLMTDGSKNHLPQRRDMEPVKSFDILSGCVTNFFSQ